MTNNKLKKIIFDKLYQDLSHVEIIPYEDSVWFIDREKQYWYFEYKKSGTLWWRYYFFVDFFVLFSMYEDEFQWVISEWVEVVLNHKVATPIKLPGHSAIEVEVVLNHKVATPYGILLKTRFLVEEVLNCKVVTPQSSTKKWEILAEVVLNHKVVTPIGNFTKTGFMAEEVLNCNVKYVPSSECSLRSA